MGKLIKNVLPGVLILMLSILVVNVKAESYYINSNNVEMSELEYQKMITIFNKQKTDLLTQEEFAKFNNYKIASNQTIYQRVKNTDKDIISEEYITEEEYNNAPDVEYLCEEKETNRSSDYGYIETTYKRFSVSLLEFTNDYNLSALLTWKRVPACRSYDVFAFRLNHMTYSNVYGVQAYYVGTAYTNISYNSSSPGYKSATNGAGFSMNLKDDSNITSFDMYLTADLVISDYNSSTAHVYTTYQHAITNLSRATSMSYTFNALGLGDVVYYNNTSISQKYDDMDGIHLTTPI